MCGLFGAHKNHEISTNSELKKINAIIIEESKGFLKHVIDTNQLKTCNSYNEYLQMKAKAKIKLCRGMALKAYQVS